MKSAKHARLELWNVCNLVVSYRTYTLYLAIMLCKLYLDMQTIGQVLKIFQSLTVPGTFPDAFI